MTSLVAFIASDGEPTNPSPASLYFASDSRRSWGSNEALKYVDDCQKIYASEITPELFAFTGDISFAQPILAAHLADVHSQASWTDSYTAFERLRQRVVSTLVMRDDAPVEGFTILYGARDYRGKEKTEFRLCLLSCNEDKQVNVIFTLVPKNASTSMLILDGSGARSISEAASDWKMNKAIWEDVSRVQPSRDIFRQFAETIASPADRRSGGAPQLGVIYRNGNAELIGVHTDVPNFLGRRHFQGEPQPKSWRNLNFEVCEIDGSLVNGAKPQPRPLHAPPLIGRDGHL